MENEKKIIIIDDDHELDKALEGILSAEGYEVETHTSTRFVNSFDFSKNAVFLIDLWFNNQKQGQKQIKALLKKIDPKKQSIVLMSSDAEVANIAADLGLSKYIQKPTHIPRLLSELNAIFSEHNQNL